MIIPPRWLRREREPALAPVAARRQGAPAKPAPAPEQDAIPCSPTTGGAALGRVGVFWSTGGVAGPTEAFHSSGKHVAAATWTQALARYGQIPQVDIFTPFDQVGAARRQFLTRFALAGSPGEPETSVQQALTMLNGRFVAWATDPQRCPTLIAVTQTPGMSTRQRIEALYLAALARKPTATERDRLARHVRKARAERQAEQLADVFWVLLNSAEFRLNH